MFIRRKLLWFILSRALLIILFFLTASIFDSREPQLFGEETLRSIQRLCLAAGAFSILSLASLLLPDRYLGTVSYAQVIWDMLFVSVLVLLTGGIISPYPFLYLLAIINASVLSSRREAIYTASLCAILYGAILDFQYYGRLEVLGVPSAADLYFGAPHILYTLVLNIGVFYLTAFLTGYLASRAAESEAALHEREIDFEELDRLNSAIVENIGSALVTVTPQGRIRVFNPQAEILAGLPMSHCYNRPLADIFPALPPLEALFASECMGEFVKGEGDAQIECHYRSVPFYDAAGVLQGGIIDLRDITRVRRLERDLQKADRLAAIGELSARIAHEIRNPLAAMGGAVQLISQGDIRESDRPLFAIVLREADRLNALISDFLAYARPTSPTVITVPLEQLVEEQRMLLASDPRFVHVSIAVSIPKGLSVMVDVGQFKQVLWNLCINGAESMGWSGQLSINASRGHRAGRDCVVIRIADEGGGMAEEVRRRLFEPFFTTKADGSGLGMATAYRIVEANGGTIRVESDQGCGTTFEINLPAGEERI